MLKLKDLISSKTLLSRLPTRCRQNNDCSYERHSYAYCNISTHNCQISEFATHSFDQLCSLLSNLLLPEANSTFIEQFHLHIQQCQQIIAENNSSFDLQLTQIQQTLLLQNLRNLIWTNIEYRMNKITKKSTKSPMSLSAHLLH